MKFWTVLQEPAWTAVLMEVDEQGQACEKDRIGGKTPARWVYAVGEWKTEEGKQQLVLLKHASVAFLEEISGVWSIVKEFQSRFIYRPHACVQHNGLLYILCTGHDMIIGMDPETGEVKWKWCAYDFGLSAYPKFLKRPDWDTVLHPSGRLFRPEGHAHFNSLWLSGGRLFTCSLFTNKIVCIDLVCGAQKDSDMTEELCPVAGQGIHSFFFDRNRKIVYGMRQGISVEGKVLHKQFKWVKRIVPTEEGYVLTHDAGVSFLTMDWKVGRTISLPRPFGFVRV